MANVFISYRTADYELAARLAKDIQAANHTVWLGEWEVGIGDSIIEKMNQGLAGSTYLVMCYSSHGVDVPWMGREWMSALARQLRGEKVKLLPVMFEGGQRPAILADIKYANLAADWERGLSELLRAIKD